MQNKYDDMSDLKPCPKCKYSDAQISFHGVVNSYVAYKVNCRICGFTTINYDSQKEAIDAWNKRSEV